MGGFVPTNIPIPPKNWDFPFLTPNTGILTNIK